jgi:hypothetical protein
MENYVLGIIFGVILSVFGLVAFIRVSPLAVRVALNWLTHYINHTYYAAETKPLQLPYHVIERRVLTNNHRVWFRDRGGLRSGEVYGYKRNRNKGNFYLVGFNDRELWVPDTQVWEPEELSERVAA